MLVIKALLKPTSMPMIKSLFVGFPLLRSFARWLLCNYLSHKQSIEDSYRNAFEVQTFIFTQNLKRSNCSSNGNFQCFTGSCLDLESTLIGKVYFEYEGTKINEHGLVTNY